jgi:hypothetical protein
MNKGGKTVMTAEPAGGPERAEGPRVMLEILDGKNRIVACFPTDRPDWAMDQFFRNRDLAGHTYSTREIKPAVA